jgi:hypothetical protein
LQEASGWYGEVTTAAYGYVDVTNDIQPGNNTIYLKIGTPNYHSHLHPGFRLIVVYSLTQEMQAGSQTFKKRYYFDNVNGNTGAWSMLSFYIPENAKNVNAKLHLNLKKVEDSTYSGMNTTDIKIYVNSKEPFYYDGINKENDEYYCSRLRNYYCYRSLSSARDVILDFDITNKVINGTNVVSVYVDSYGDIHWGDKEAIIYSDPLNDPENSSYVEVSYEIDKPLFLYGEIDLTKEKIFGGEASNPKTFSFNISQSESKIIEAFVHIAQGFSSMINVSIQQPNSPKTTVFTSPSSRVVPENVFVYPRLIGSQNTIEIVDFQSYGGISPTNYILPWSSFEYTYLVKGIVGYGSVFNSSELAIQDAINRLIQQVGSEGIAAENIQTDTQSTQGIKWLWGPALFKILIWDKL